MTARFHAILFVLVSLSFTLSADDSYLRGASYDEVKEILDHAVRYEGGEVWSIVGRTMGYKDHGVYQTQIRLTFRPEMLDGKVCKVRSIYYYSTRTEERWRTEEVISLAASNYEKLRCAETNPDEEEYIKVYNWQPTGREFLDFLDAERKVIRESLELAISRDIGQFEMEAIEQGNAVKTIHYSKPGCLLLVDVHKDDNKGYVFAGVNKINCPNLASDVIE